MKCLLSFIILLILHIDAVFAQFTAVNGKTQYPFLIQTYEDSSEEKAPILLFLHGRSLSGNDLNRVKRYGVLSAIKRGKDLPAIVVAPQTNNGWDADRIAELLDFVIEEYNGDASRVYVCGMSMGAYGTLEFAGKYPERVASAVAICGGGDMRYACNLTQVPLWLSHGTNDRAVPVSESKKIVAAIRNCNEEADVRLSLIPGGTHGSVERLFHQDEMYEWMFGYKKEDDKQI